MPVTSSDCTTWHSAAPSWKLAFSTLIFVFAKCSMLACCQSYKWWSISTWNYRKISKVGHINIISSFRRPIEWDYEWFVSSFSTRKQFPEFYVQIHDPNVKLSSSLNLLRIIYLKPNVTYCECLNSWTEVLRTLNCIPKNCKPVLSEKSNAWEHIQQLYTRPI